jgi:hypothetical protein
VDVEHFGFGIDDSRNDILMAVQLAAIFELRFYEKYYDVTLRIIKLQQNFWTKKLEAESESGKEKLEYYKNEFNDIENYILEKQRWYNKIKKTIWDYIKYSFAIFMLYFMFLLITK